MFNLLFYRKYNVLVLPTIADKDVVGMIVIVHACILQFSQSLQSHLANIDSAEVGFRIRGGCVVRAALAWHEELRQRVTEEIDLLGEDAREMIFLNGVVGLDVQNLLRRLLRSEKRGRHVDDMQSPISRAVTYSCPPSPFFHILSSSPATMTA